MMLTLRVSIRIPSHVPEVGKFNRSPIGNSCQAPKHQSSDRGFYKARNELISAQKERRKSETGFDSQDLAKPAETPLESSAPPDPPHETIPKPGLSIPAPPDPLDCETLDEAFEVLMKGPDGEMAKRMIDEWKVRRKVA